MRLSRPLALASALLLAACSTEEQGEAPQPAVLCAAEALKASRDVALSTTEQNRWRDRIPLFEAKIPQSKHNAAHSKIEELAHQNEARTLIDRAQCEALLGDPDPASVLNSAEQAPQ